MAESVLSAADAAFCDRFSFSADNKPLTGERLHQMLHVNTYVRTYI